MKVWGLTINLDKDVVGSCCLLCNKFEIYAIMNDAGDLWEIEEIYDVWNGLNSFVKSKSAKKRFKTME